MGWEEVEPGDSLGVGNKGGVAHTEIKSSHFCDHLTLSKENMVVSWTLSSPLFDIEQA